MRITSGVQRLLSYMLLFLSSTYIQVDMDTKTALIFNNFYGRADFIQKNNFMYKISFILLNLSVKLFFIKIIVKLRYILKKRPIDIVRGTILPTKGKQNVKSKNPRINNKKFFWVYFSI